MAPSDSGGETADGRVVAEPREHSRVEASVCGVLIPVPPED
jgi:hypothetical protein